MMLVKKDPDIIKSFLEDYSNLKGGSCSAVLLPESQEELRDAIIECSAKRIPVTVSGAGTGVAGGRIPFGGRVVSLANLNKIEYIEPLKTGGAKASLGAGTVLQDFLDAVDGKGFFYPPDPTEKTSFIGGNIATSASGARGFKYGSTRNFVTGITVLLASGQILELKRGRHLAVKRKLKLSTSEGKDIILTLPGYSMPGLKNAAGYYVKDGMDAVDLFIGQEGTLGIILKAELRLLEKPYGILDCYAFFKDENDAIRFTHTAKIKTTEASSDIEALSIEYLDSHALKLLRNRHSNIPESSMAAVYFEQETRRENEAVIIDSWAGIIAKCGGSLENTWFAQTPSERQRLSEIRHDLPDMVNEYLKKNGFPKIGTDIAVRDNSLNIMMDYYKALLAEAGLKYLIFGHIGESHLHVNILPRSSSELEKAKAVYETLVSKAVSLGGTPSAEHGIGKVKHRYLELLYGDKAIEDMVNLKKQLDPQCILGLDNIFAKELLA